MYMNMCIDYFFSQSIFVTHLSITLYNQVREFNAQFCLKIQSAFCSISVPNGYWGFFFGAYQGLNNNRR